ncbi:MAG: hypothetical protein ACI94Y_002269 [Maribacter sp.]|jgi:hypothetical protein
MEFKRILEHINQKITLTKGEKTILVSKLKLRTYLKGQYIVQEEDVYKKNLYY